VTCKLTVASFGRTELSSTTNRRAAIGLDEYAIAAVQTGVRHRLLRTFAPRGLLTGDDARTMAQWEHKGGFSVDGSVGIESDDAA
jgi:hypothetical protein